MCCLAKLLYWLRADCGGQCSWPSIVGSDQLVQGTRDVCQPDLCVGLQAVVGTVERASSQFARAVKDALDPKKLSAGAASAGGGLLGGPGGATRADAPAPGTSAKWQVSVHTCLRARRGACQSSPP